MSGDGQRGPGSGGTADRGRPGAGQARQDAGGDRPPGDGQDHAGTPRPDALIPALDEGQLEQRPDLILTVAVPELVDRHWWHRILYEPVAGRLQRA